MWLRDHHRHGFHVRVVAQHFGRDMFGDTFDQPEPGLTNQGSNTSRNDAVVDGIGDLVASAGRTRVNIQLETDHQGLFDLPLPGIETDDGINRDIADRQPVHHAAIMQKTLKGVWPVRS